LPVLRSVALTLGSLGALALAASVSAADQATTAPAAQGATSVEPVTLVVHTAKDCPICKVWRESPSGLATATQLPREWPRLKLVIIERDSLYGSESESLYPQELQYMYQIRSERYQLSPPVPMFEIVSQGKLISRHAGLQGWADGTVPEVRALQSAAQR
jgi:hypothetical protein